LSINNCQFLLKNPVNLNLDLFFKKMTALYKILFFYYKDSR